MIKNDTKPLSTSPVHTHQKIVPFFGTTVQLKIELMKMSELAQKKIDRFSGCDHVEREEEFASEFIYGAKPPIPRNFGVTFDNFLPVVTRCHKAGGRVIGVEIHVESKYPFFVYTWEEYSEVYEPEWVLHVWLDLIANQVSEHIVPVMDFPVRILDENL